MKFRIQPVNFDADKKLIKFINKKLSKFDKFKGFIIDGEIFLKIENKRSSIKDKTVEIKLNIKKNILFVKEQSKNMEEAVDTAVETMHRKVKRYKEKIRDN